MGRAKKEMEDRLKREAKTKAEVEEARAAEEEHRRREAAAARKAAKKNRSGDKSYRVLPAC